MVLPEPEGPTIAYFLPASNLRESLFSACDAGSYEKERFFISIPELRVSIFTNDLLLQCSPIRSEALSIIDKDVFRLEKLQK